MSLLADMITQEKSRIEKMIDSYSKELESLPKGVLVKKNIGKNSYFYLQYRDGKKTVSTYIGKDEATIEVLQAQIKKRKHTEEMLKMLWAEHALAMKMEG